MPLGISTGSRRPSLSSIVNVIILFFQLKAEGEKLKAVSYQSKLIAMVYFPFKAFGFPLSPLKRRLHRKRWYI
jgi:hypothetical protein